MLFAGGLFHPEDDRQEVAFKYAVDRINADRSVLPRSRLTAQIERISPQDSFHASKRGQSNSFFAVRAVKGLGGSST
jgi:glutamate receptor, ionotropic, invertebrate